MKTFIDCIVACGIWSTVLIKFLSRGAAFSDDAWIITWSIIIAAIIIRNKQS